jgi:alpha-N-arabinofuranosidase
VALAVGLSCASGGSTTPPHTPEPQQSDSPSTPAPFANPILPGFYPDPSICRVGDDYYLVTSTFEYFPGVPIFHSRDLVNWRQIGHALTRASQLPLQQAKSSEGIFAPTIRHHNGTFYVVTTNVSGGGSFYVTARDPAGQWSEPVWLPEETFTMDPSLLFDGDGRVYYTRHGGGEHGGAYQAEIDIGSGQLRGAPTEIWSGTGGVWPEGPHLYAIDGTYYLMQSEGGTSTNHSITVARSASPGGPFEPFAGNPIITHRGTDKPIQATGHGDLVQAADGHWWLVLLGIRRPDGENHHLGRETYLAPVSFDDEGWPVVNQGRGIDLEMSGEGLPPRQPWPEDPARDEFAGPDLALQWNFVRNPSADRWSLSESPGALRLKGSGASLRDVASPAFVGRRQQHFRSRAAAALSFTPDADGQHAGLAVRANEDNHYHLTVTRSGGERRIQLATRLKGEATVVADQSLGAGEVVLSIEAFADRYEFGYSLAGGATAVLGSAPTAPLSSERAGGFTGVYFGMLAWADGATRMPPADFAWFEYAPVAER